MTTLRSESNGIPVGTGPADALREGRDAALAPEAALRVEAAGKVTPVGTLTRAEEFATLTKVVEEGALVRVRTETETLDHTETAELGVERVEVDRQPVNAWVDAMPQSREEDGVLIVPVVEERLVIEKRLFVTEEIRIRRHRSTERVEVPVTLRRQVAHVERLAPDALTAGETPTAVAAPLTNTN